MSPRSPANPLSGRVLLAIGAAVVLTLPPAVAANTYRTTNLTLVAHDDLDPSRLRAVGERAEADLSALADFIGADTPLPRIRVHVYPTLESKGLATGYTMPTHAFAAREPGRVADVHVAAESGFEGSLSREIAAVVLRRVLGRPKTDALEAGLSVLLADDWRGRGSLYWAARLAALDDLHDPAVLVDNRSLRRESPLVARPMAAALVSFLVQRWGKAEFLRRYATWRPTREETADLRGDWGEYLRALRRRHEPDERDRWVPAFQRGFCHAHEGYQIHNGYASAKSDDALAKLASLGTNAVSITPFTYMRGTARPAPLPFSSGPGSENDESVIHAALAAKRLGMVVMLKPHVWVGGSWPGEIEMKRERDWDAFFEHYYCWMRHYALLAEMYEVEILCVGVELSKTTRSQEERWAKLIDRLRTVYRGRLTYAANWGEEFESTPLWRHLDYIGVNCYYPLSDSPNASDEDLMDGVEAVMRKIEAVAECYDKPVIITEVGFASAAAPWVTPYERRRGVAVDADAQARCYELFFRGLVGRPRFAGVYWWKWPSFLEHGGPRHAGFTPNGKPAEDIVRRWYGEILSD